MDMIRQNVADKILVDERDLAKLVSCVFLNAIKFTEQGRISLRANLTSKAKFIVINVLDTGPGIPKAFLPNLFKPFSREDDSLTRQKEGLGLGLLVAKGLARKIGGDLICVRSETEGPRRGSEFELRVPISYTDSSSRASTPNRTPTPARPNASEPTAKPCVRQTSSVERRRTPRSHQTPHAGKTPDPSPFAKATSPLDPTSQSRRNSLSQLVTTTPSRRLSTKEPPTFDRNLAKKHPLTFLIAEDNKLNRKLLVSMLGKLGYTGVHEAYDGAEAVHQMSIDRVARGDKPIDVILMDLWMPNMDGYEATQRIFANEKDQRGKLAEKKHRKRSARTDTDDDDDRARRKMDGVTVLAVSADVTDSALERAREVGMEGFMTKPYKLLDLERLILEYCAGDAKDRS
ncbi:hypothetical protein OEA41_004400 [Lepraria neglecta]|uniref:histidine kinase n=1 Tax=Lepraria neglecta TaxID=209136 RepID=A0AAD9YXJ6_9LECA|nr:hypothetical protein OEA41_004400 [Lepraria neglecta]